MILSLLNSTTPMAEPTSLNGAKPEEASSGKDGLVPINDDSTEFSDNDAKSPSNASIYQVLSFSRSSPEPHSIVLIIILENFPCCDITGKNLIPNRHSMFYWVRNYTAFDDSYLRELRDHIHGILDWDDRTQRV